MNYTGILHKECAESSLWECSSIPPYPHVQALTLVSWTQEKKGHEVNSLVSNHPSYMGKIHKTRLMLDYLIEI